MFPIGVTGGACHDRRASPELARARSSRARLDRPAGAVQAALLAAALRDVIRRPAGELTAPKTGMGGRVLRELPGAYRLLRHRTTTPDQRTTVMSTKPARGTVTYSTAAGSTAGIAVDIPRCCAPAGSPA